MTVSTTVRVDDQVTVHLSRTAAKLGRLDDVLEEVGASNVTETQQRFEDEETPEGKDWKDLSKATLAKPGRTGDGGTARILRYKAELYDSLGYKVIAGGVRVGVNMVYGRIHQLGGFAGRKRKVFIPARPYLGVSEVGAKEILQIFDDHIAKGVK